MKLLDIFGVGRTLTWCRTYMSDIKDFVHPATPTSKASGIKMSVASIEEFNQLKLKQKYKYLIYKVDIDQGEVITETSREKDKKKISMEEEAEYYEEFCAILKSKMDDSECRYGVYDKQFMNKSDVLKNKILFVQWCPDTCSIKKKMVYSSSSEHVKNGIQASTSCLCIQGNDMSDLAIEEVMSRVMKFEN